MASNTDPFAGESKADAWLLEHSKFLRKNFSRKGPCGPPSKHTMIQEQASGEDFSRETEVDPALFEYSKFLRKHVKHDENIDGGIRSKSRTPRKSWDGNRPKTAETVTHRSQSKEDLDEIDYSNDADNSSPAEDKQYITGADLATVPMAVPILTASTRSSLPAWQVATDNGCAYGDETSLRSAAAVPSGRPPGPGLIEHHPTTMESTPANSRPVPHSLMSNSAHAGNYDDVRGEDAR